MNTAWRRWPSNDPKALIEYVQRKRHGESTPGTPADLLGTALPAPGDTPPIDRAQALYEAFADRDIVYADEPTSSDPGRQTVRPPYEVLTSPRHGTCLDLAVTFAGACLDAGLHPLLLVTGGSGGGPAHALVSVWLDGNWSNRAHRDYPARETDAGWQTLPPDFLDQLADAEDAPGAFLAVDVTGAASRSDAADPRRRRPQSWAEAVAYGAELVRQAAAEDRLAVTLDVGLGYEQCEPLPLPDQPRTKVLTPPYLPVDDSADSADSGPLKLLWARHETIRFHPRDELDFLQDLFQAPDPQGPRTRIALLHGVGGAGKTRLAAELARRLSGTAWFTGFLVREPDLHDCAWLGRVASPLLVVVDYADDHKSADIINLLRTLHDREAPTCLLLTARSISGWWEDVANAIKDDGGLKPLVRPVPLPPRHHRQAGVYRYALRSFGTADATAMSSSPPPDPNSGRWTTLDLVMLAWLAARAHEENGDSTAPASESALYEEILKHELKYWVRTYKSHIGPPSKRTLQMLREAGACVSLLSPRENRLNAVLNAVAELAADARRRDEVTALLEDLLPTTPEDGTVAVRPDPIGSHLASTVFHTDHPLLSRCLETADPDEQLNACVGVSRLSTVTGPTEAAAMARRALEAVPELWSAALSVAAAQGGPFVGALERFAADESTSLPFAALAVTLPMGHSNLRGLALIATERSRPDETAESDEEARATLAGWYNNLSIRQSDTGDQLAALESITEAVTHYRALAHGPNGPAHLPNLATTLNNLSNCLSNTGDQQAALAFATEAVAHYRTLTQGPNGPAHLPNLAGSLNNLCGCQSETGDQQAALASATEAVSIRRTLTQGPNGPAYLPDLANSLNNLSNCQSNTGDWQNALASITEAVAHYRTLAQGPNGPAHLSDLAMSLNNLSNCQSETGDQQAALASATEAVSIRRTLTQGPNGPAHLPNLAGSLNNLCGCQSETGDQQAALASATEAVSIRRTLTQGPNGPAYLPDLANSLNNLSNCQASTGDWQNALASITEAVARYRTLAQGPNGPAYLPDLAGSLNNLSNRQDDTGDQQAALASAIEAVAHYRTLTQGPNGPAYLPDLAMSLNNLSNRQSSTGDWQNALASITEAVAHYRTLAQGPNGPAYLPNLASSLNNLSNQQGDTGDQQAALASITEAVAHYRTLTQGPNGPAYLPDLAMSLNNLSNCQSNTGDQQAALASATEAVSIRRALTQGPNGPAYLPDLASSLNNLSNCQNDTDDWQNALASITEAVAHYRTLTQGPNGPAHLPDLAMSLNNLSNCQGNTGDWQNALASITEAVAHYRALTQGPNGPAYLPNLAGSLNNLSNCQNDTDDWQNALASITEAVAHYRTLTQGPNGPAHLPNLAMSLNNLSNRQSSTGDQQAALASATEAVSIRRTLTQGPNGPAYLPDLANSLNNLSNRQDDTGDQQAALASITEAVTVHRALAQGPNGPAHLPDLAMSLNNLSNRQSSSRGQQSGLLTSDEVISGFAPGPQAELLISRARWRFTHDDLAGAVADLMSAAQFADGTTDPTWAGRSRRAVRAFIDMVRQSPTTSAAMEQAAAGLPAWAVGILPDQSVERFNRWLSAQSWPDQESFLQQTYALLATPEEQAALDVVRALYPETTALSRLSDLVQEASERGLEQVLDERRRVHTAYDLVSRWLATPTWPEDLQFLRDHPGLTSDPLIRALLTSNPEDVASSQHLGILELTERLEIPDVYDAVTDPTTAVDTAMGFVEQGQPEAVYPLLLAAPVLTHTPFVTPYLFAVHQLFSQSADENQSSTPAPAELIAQAAEQGSEIQRGAGANRLRALARHRPGHAAALHDLADALAPPSEGTPAGEPASDAG
ncbi:tetratricopeptide repeat protein [Streptomyces sp. NBC_01275]|uniref:tetratricopeptide repeat protein n=1 Tax=Streptomyces sp. NBC_01275 TaxID=2903807 RepID=UPI00224F5662|nr:tetratricopeptide repeat protein [Streptomyces sp. NBC_01275]MCX4761733.1 tetratricopeptide repeat protein [Streptomyces sp. NBC_01275]